MPDIEIKRGYEVLPDNNVRFGIRVINNSDVIISDVEVLLDYSESLFQLEGSKVQKLGTIPPSVPRTAKFILKPLAAYTKKISAPPSSSKTTCGKNTRLRCAPRKFTASVHSLRRNPSKGLISLPCRNQALWRSAD